MFAIPTRFTLYAAIGAAVTIIALSGALVISRTQITALEAQVSAAKDSTTAARVERDAALSANAYFETENKRLADQWTELQRTKREALDAAEAERVRIAADAASWKAKWDSRPKACGSLLVEMEAACASLSDY